jgi:DNA-binding Lrp family transcriptional regulator
LKLDPIDLVILKELNADGRASLRQIAKKSSLSTPTVSSRFERMKKAGLIQKFVPVLSPDASDDSSLLAFVTLNAPSSSIEKIAKELGGKPGVIGVFVTTGANNLVLRVSVRNAQSLHRFLTSAEFRKLGAEVTGSQIITETVKDEHPLPFIDEIHMKLSCDLCKGVITSNTPYTIRVASTRYYFCCKTCKATYLQKHGDRIRTINKAN